MPTTLRLILITVLLLTVQTTIVSFMSVFNIVPDIMVIWIVYIAITQGQIRATAFGFGIGLTIDLVSGQFLGLSALCKTLAGFIAGYFFQENKIEITLGNYRFMVIVAVISFVHNMIYFVIFTQGSDVGSFEAIFRFGLVSSLYTTTVSSIPMFMAMRKPQLR